MDAACDWELSDQTQLIAQLSIFREWVTISHRLSALPFSTYWSAGLWRGLEELAQALRGLLRDLASCWTRHLGGYRPYGWDLFRAWTGSVTSPDSRCRTNRIPVIDRSTAKKPLTILLLIITKHPFYRKKINRVNILKSTALRLLWGT